MARKRLNPAERRRYVRAPSGRKRLATSGQTGDLNAHSDREPTALPQRSVAGADGTLLVVPDMLDARLSDQDKDVLGAAHGLAAARDIAVAVLCLSDMPLDIDWSAFGADRLIEMQRPANYAPKWDIDAILAAIDHLSPRHILAPDCFPGIGHVLRRFAVASGRSIATHVKWIAEDTAHCTMADLHQDAAVDVADILLMESGCGQLDQSVRYEAKPIAIRPPDAVAGALTSRGELAIDRANLALEEADFIVSGGAGVKDWDTFHALAEALNATKGGTRVVCDEGLLPKSRQVGASGTLVDARCYLAMGIAGAPQHLQGVVNCEHVIAVNTDLHADMVKRAQLAIIADAQAIMPALITLLEAEQPV